MSQYYPNLIVIRGVSFTTPPGKWQNVNSSPFGIRESVAPVVSGTNIQIVHTPFDISDNNIGLEQRVLKNQAWNATWDTGSFMDTQMANYLQLLYSNNIPFFIQFDDEETRAGLPTYFSNPSGDLQTFLSPTWPIFPRGTVGNNDHFNTQSFTWATSTDIFLNGVAGIAGNTCFFSEEMGIIRFETPLLSTVQVSAMYTWRAYVRISALNLHSFNIADEVYMGTVEFEQIPFPILDIDYSNIVLPLPKDGMNWVY